MIEYEFWLRNPAGVLIRILDLFISATIYRSVNQIGRLTLVLPWGIYPESIFEDNSIIQVWRSINGKPMQLVGDCPFFVQTAIKGLTSAGIKTLEISAYDPMYFLSTHSIDYAAGVPQTVKSGHVDDVIKAFVRENLGALATVPARNMEPWITTAADAGLAPSTTKSASHRPLLTVLQELASDSFTKGTYLAFDIVCSSPTTGIALEFRTYINVRGVDHRWPSSTLPVILDPDNGNLTDCLRAKDNLNMANVVTAGGQNEGVDRVIKTATNAASVAQSVWNRHELFIDARNSSSDAGVQAEADAALFENRKRTLFSGRFVPTEGMQFDQQFGYGDFITAVWDNEQYDLRVDLFSLNIQEGIETPDIALRSDV